MAAKFSGFGLSFIHDCSNLNERGCEELDYACLFPQRVGGIRSDEKAIAEEVGRLEI
jgi:hypothetical protein